MTEESGFAPPPMDRLWSGWRLANFPDLAADGREHAHLESAPGLSLFETLVQADLPDQATYILWRGQHVFVILNIYPYTSGHMMVLPKVAVPSIHDLAAEVYTELWDTVRVASEVAKTALKCHGLNIGLNEGSAGGASQPDHLHVHVVPRWHTDTNFMTTVAEMRTVPETLGDTWQRLRAGWPQ